MAAEALGADERARRARRLRATVEDCIRRRLDDAAVFYADKLVSLSSWAPDDILLLGRAYYGAGQYRRAVLVLRQCGVLEPGGRPAAPGAEPAPPDLRFFVLAAQCLAACKEWTECLTLVGDDDDTAVERLPVPVTPVARRGRSGSAARGGASRTPRRSRRLLAAELDDESGGDDSGAERREAEEEEEEEQEEEEEEEEQAGTDAAAGRTKSSRARRRGRSGSARAGGAAAGPVRGDDADDDAGDGDSDDGEGEGDGDGAGVSDEAVLALLRGMSYEALENRQRAIAWYSVALRRDARCVEAFERLVAGRMLGHDQERELLRSLRFPPRDRWLRDLFRFRVDSYARSGEDLRPRMEALEAANGLEESTEMLSALARSYYAKRDFRRCYEASKQVIVRDPYDVDVLPVHLCSLVELGMKSELFYCAHQLVEAYPGKAVSWFSVGCYYLLTGKNDLARTYFTKSSAMDNHFAPAWIGFGNAFAAQDESDQALAAYRTAARLFEGAHVPLLYIGMEYLRTLNVSLAGQFLERARQLHSSDPLVYNELGAAAFKAGDYEGAVAHFEHALDLAGSSSLAPWEATLFNLGHALRKLRRYDAALDAYGRARRLAPRNYSIDVAIGFTHQLSGELDRAVECMHRALGVQPRDTLANDLLTLALEEMLNA